MTPESTTYTVPNSYTGYSTNQTIHPSELNLWRVIRKTNDGKIEMVSEYVSSTAIYFTGVHGYKYYVQTIQDIAKQYENDLYTDGSRHVGYSNQSLIIYNSLSGINNNCWNHRTYDKNWLDGALEPQGCGDRAYKTDVSLLQNALGTLASNKVFTNETGNYFLSTRTYTNEHTSATTYRNVSLYLQVSNSYGSEYSGIRLMESDAEVTSSAYIRPIVVLKSGLKVSGTGEKDNPWKFKNESSKTIKE